jgi:hypothetical protein
VTKFYRIFLIELDEKDSSTYGANFQGHILFIRTLILAACKCRQSD